MAGAFASALLLGTCLGCAAAASSHAQCDAVGKVDCSHLEMELLGDTRASASGECAYARIALENGGHATVQAIFPDGRQALRGDRFAVSGSITAANWDSDELLWQNGAVGRLRVRSVEEVDALTPLSPLLGIRARAIDAIGASDDERALLQALVCGYRRNIEDTALYAEFQACGLAHLVAVSGAHLVIVTGLVATLLRALRLPRRLVIVALIAVMGSYLVVSGMPVSAVRASVMSSIGILALVGRRRPSALNALGVGVFLIVGSDPAASVSASFALSALSTAGIILFSPLISSWLDSTPISGFAFAADALSLTLASALLSQPYACSIFHQLPLISPLANIACAPLFPVVCGAGLLAGVIGCAAPALAPAATALAAALAHALSCLVRLIASAPLASVPASIGTVAALAFSSGMAALLWLAWPRFKAKAAASTAAAALFAFAVMSLAVSGEDAIIMLDVGQGDAFLVRSQGQTLLIDTGNHDSQLLEQLARCGAYRLDSVLVTHSDDDHCGSLDALEKAVHVDRVLLADGMCDDGSPASAALVAQARRTAGELVELRMGDRFGIGRFTAEVVWPERLADGGGNADSVCLLLDYDGDGDGIADLDALFTGDAEKDQLARILERGRVASVDVLKVGHHGSRNGMTEDEVEELSPRIALIGVGANNRYGHPTQEILDMLDGIGCRTFRSDKDGQVKCAFSGSTVSVSTTAGNGM